MGHDMKEILHPRSRVPETVYNQRVQAPDFVGAIFFRRPPTVASPRKLVALRWAKFKHPLRGCVLRVIRYFLSAS